MVRVDPAPEERLREPIRVATYMITNLLVQNQFQLVENITRGRAYLAKDLREALIIPGDRLMLPPPDSFSTLQPTRIPDTIPPAFLVEVALWWEKQGRSTVHLTLRLDERPTGNTVDAQIVGLSDGRARRGHLKSV